MSPTQEILDPVEREDFAQGFADPTSKGALATTGRGATVKSETTIWGNVTTALRVDKPRDEADVLRKIKTRAAAAGERWYYRFPVKKRGGGVDYIEGPTIKCANAVSRLYGNCAVDCVVEDPGGPVWIIYSRFRDFETGYALVRPFEQSKAAGTLGGEDEMRRRAQAMAVGVSKSERNVIVNALDEFTTFAFEEAYKNLVERVGKNIDRYRARIAERLAELAVDVKRVEATAGRPMAEWLAPDVARIIAELNAVRDGMAMADDVWPRPPAPPEPRRDDPQPPATSDAPQTAAQDKPATGGVENESKPSHPLGEATHESQPAEEPPPPKVWRIDDAIIGQENLIKALGNLLDVTESEADVDELERQNAERIAKITGVKRSTLNNAFRVRRETLKAERES